MSAPMMERDNFEDGWSWEGEEAGLYWNDFGRALLYWASMQFREVTVAEAASTFNAAPDTIVAAVLNTAFLDVTGNHETPPTERLVIVDGE